MWQETDGEDDGAGEFRVDGDSDEQGDELNGLETGGWPCRNESGRTRGFGFALGLVRRLAVTSLVDS